MCADGFGLGGGTIYFFACLDRFIDNLYLDMNGIIHRCSHPDADSVKNVTDEETIFIAIFNYIDRLFHVVKPRKTFFMAVDG